MATLIWLVIIAYVGPILLGALRRVDGLAPLLLANVLALIMPPLLLVAWWMAFKLPSKENAFD